MNDETADEEIKSGEGEMRDGVGEVQRTLRSPSSKVGPTRRRRVGGGVRCKAQAWACRRRWRRRCSCSHAHAHAHAMHAHAHAHAMHAHACTCARSRYRAARSSSSLAAIRRATRSGCSARGAPRPPRPGRRCVRDSCHDMASPRHDHAITTAAPRYYHGTPPPGIGWKQKPGPAHGPRHGPRPPWAR